jgi:hypothetical protein
MARRVSRMITNDAPIQEFVESRHIKPGKLDVAV